MEFLLQSFKLVTFQHVIMYAIGGLLIFLGIKKKIEPSLLIPMGFGAILVNIPLSGVLNQEMAGIGQVHGIIDWLFNTGIAASEMMPLLLFIGIGAMIDFSPLLKSPKLLFLGAMAQAGIFITIIIARASGFSLIDSVSIGTIAAADGPTALLVSNVLKSKYIGAIAVVAYSYMALVPIIQPAVIKLCTTKKERLIRMTMTDKPIPHVVKILFPIVVTLIAGFLAPASVSLVGFLMFGNLIRECGVLNGLSDTAQKTLVNLITLLLGITISANMRAEQFVTWDTLLIMVIGAVAFAFDTFFGIFTAKFMNLFSKNKINPMVGAAGISAFPMAARVVQKMGLKEDPENHLLFHAIGANVGGQIASVLAGGMILNLVQQFL